jgi:TolB protein
MLTGSGERALTQPGTLDYNPAWSPSGDWILFTSERAGSADLYRIHPDGTGLDRLTDDPAYDDQGALSPDGKQVVFVSTRAAGRANLWVMVVATRKARPLTSGDGGDFRPAVCHHENQMLRATIFRVNFQNEVRPGSS